MTSPKHSASRLLRALVMPLLVLSAILAPWVAAQFCNPTCRCENLLGTTMTCMPSDYPQCFNPNTGASVSFVLTNTLQGCCSLGSCTDRSCKYDISITVQASTNFTWCFYITSLDGLTTACLAGDCDCTCATPGSSLGYTATGVEVKCGTSVNYFVNVCGVGEGCWDDLDTFQIDAIWRFPYLCADC